MIHASTVLPYQTLKNNERPVKMKIKIIKTLCSILSSGTIMLTGISAGAAEKIINPEHTARTPL